MSSRDDGGYVHDPSTFDEDGGRVAEESGRDDGDGDADDSDRWLRDPVHPEAVDRRFDWRGWVLVAAIVVAFVVAPVSILLWPPGYNYFVALLILPLVPALLLAVVAVWATTRP